MKFLLSQSGYSIAATRARIDISLKRAAHVAGLQGVYLVRRERFGGDGFARATIPGFKPMGLCF
jgi:hypothetical protein